MHDHHDADDDGAAFEDAVERMEREVAAVRLVSSVDGRWVRTAPGRSAYTAAGAYAAEERLVSILDELTDGRPVHAVAEGADIAEAVTGRVDGSGRQRVESIPLSEVPAEAAPRSPALVALEQVIAELDAPDFDPDARPVLLSHLADAALDDALGGAPVEETVLAAPRRQDGFPFEAYGALAGAGTLSRATATEAVLLVRRELETCVEIFAERWATFVHLPVTATATLRPSPSPTSGYGRAYAPAAHHVGDWLELAAAEVAEGRGNLVLLGRRVAEDTDQREEDGRLVPARPLTADQWHLWMFHEGVVTRIRLRSRPGVPVATLGPTG